MPSSYLDDTRFKNFNKSLHAEPFIYKKGACFQTPFYIQQLANC